MNNVDLIEVSINNAISESGSESSYIVDIKININGNIYNESKNIKEKVNAYSVHPVKKRLLDDIKFEEIDGHGGIVRITIIYYTKAYDYFSEAKFFDVLFNRGDCEYVKSYYLNERKQTPILKMVTENKQDLIKLFEKIIERFPSGRLTSYLLDNNHINTDEVKKELNYFIEGKDSDRRYTDEQSKKDAEEFLKELNNIENIA
ncbi:MAG: hypothetical protein WC644_04325 [Ignavibacteria bacterium]